MSSRSLYSLAVAENGPKIFTRCNRWGLPYYAVLASSLFAPLAYLDCSTQVGEVFNWFISLTNTAGYLSWIFCDILYLRFRKACEVQGVSLPFRSRLQPYASWVALSIFTFLLLINGFTVFYSRQFTVSGFFTAYVGILLFLILYFGHKFLVAAERTRPWVHNSESVDLVSGVAEVEADEELWTNQETSERQDRLQTNGVWKRFTMLWE